VWDSQIGAQSKCIFHTQQKVIEQQYYFFLPLSNPVLHIFCTHFCTFFLFLFFKKEQTLQQHCDRFSRNFKVHSQPQFSFCWWKSQKKVTKQQKSQEISRPDKQIRNWYVFDMKICKVFGMQFDLYIGQTAIKNLHIHRSNFLIGDYGGFWSNFLMGF
jgi:hypothetical protein